MDLTVALMFRFQTSGLFSLLSASYMLWYYGVWSVLPIVPHPNSSLLIWMKTAIIYSPTYNSKLVSRRYFDEFYFFSNSGLHWLSLYWQKKHWDNFTKFLLLFFHRRKVWNVMGVSKWRQRVHLWVNYPSKEDHFGTIVCLKTVICQSCGTVGFAQGSKVTFCHNAHSCSMVGELGNFTSPKYFLPFIFPVLLKIWTLYVCLCILCISL